MPYKNKEDQVASIKAYRAKNKESISKQKKEYLRKNRELINAKKKEYYQKNKELLSERGRKYRALNKDIEKARKERYLITNKEQVATWRAKRRALLINAEAIMTKEEVENYKNLVIIRDEATALFGYQWHIDHTIPLSQGGTNAIDNLEVVPASWNLEKNNKHSQSFWG